MSSTLPHNPSRHDRLRDLVDRAAERPAAEWSAFLERECPADADLRAEALRLLQQAQAASAEHFLDPPVMSGDPGSLTEVHQALEPGSPDPTQIGKYQVVRRFSEVGGQAAAYLAFDPDLQRHVVLKRYHEGSDPQVLAEEGRALARVVSPYVARCHGVERDGGGAYLVVEYVPGRNLAEVRGDGPLGIAQVVRILEQLAEGVAAVHACGLIHRDIKPANVILHDDGTPRLVDFGLATHLGSRRLRELSGSPRHMAPEQARAESDRIDYRTDVFGLGSVLYELLTGRTPHAGSTRSEILDHAKRGDVTPPRLLDPTIPAPLEAVCLKALSAAPENRYTTALEFAAALRQAVEPTSVAAPKPAKRPAWVRRGLPAAAVACGLLALAGWLWPRGSEPVPPVVPPPIPPRPAGLLQAEIAVNHFKDFGAGMPVRSQGLITADALDRKPPLLKDLVRVRVELTRAAYVYLIALNPDGKDQACPTDAGSPRAILDYPPHPDDYFPLTDGVGLQAFVVVASERPLPAYEVWKAQVPGGLTWPTMDWDGFCAYDSTAVAAPRVTGRLRGEPVRRAAAPKAFVTLCDRLGQMPGVALVRAVAFPVKPDQEILK